MNQFVTIVNLTADPELKESQSGTKFCNFSGAYNEKYKDQEYCSFFDFVAWGKLAELICQYVKKGHRLAITANARQDRWEDDNGNKRNRIKFNVEKVKFLTPRNETKNNITEDDIDF